MVRQNQSHPAHSQVRMAEILAALSLATDLGTGKPMGHALRSCYLGMALARALRLTQAEQVELYYSFLLMHSGCTALSLGLTPIIHGDELAAIGDGTLRDDTSPLDMLRWMGQNVSPNAPLLTRLLHIIEAMLHSRDEEEHLRGVCEVAFRVTQRLGMPPGVQDAVRCYLERWDGKGPFGLQGEAIPMGARLISAALTIDAFTTARGRRAAEMWAFAQKGKAFDPQIIEVFSEVTKHPNLWETLAKDDLGEVVLELEPDSPYRYLNDAKVDDVALAVADFVDLKSPLTVSHSRDTARIAEAIAARMELSPREIIEIRRAALVRDLGHVALPAYLLLHQDKLSEVDRERVRLHPYYTERVLSRVPGLTAVAAIAGKHHERLNGTGYYRGLSGNMLSTSDCILALADEFQARMQDHAAHGDPDPKAVLKAMQPEVGTLFSPRCFEALAQEIGVAMPKARRESQWPVGLTDREVEVLRLLATGPSNRQIAKALVVTEKTVAHHLEHIYNKIGISSRAAAVYFAMEHELIR